MAVDQHDAAEARSDRSRRTNPRAGRHRCSGAARCCPGNRGSSASCHRPARGRPGCRAARPRSCATRSDRIASVAEAEIGVLFDAAERQDATIVPLRLGLDLHPVHLGNTHGAILASTMCGQWRTARRDGEISAATPLRSSLTLVPGDRQVPFGTQSAEGLMMRRCADLPCRAYRPRARRRAARPRSADHHQALGQPVLAVLPAAISSLSASTTRSIAGSRRATGSSGPNS